MIDSVLLAAMGSRELGSDTAHAIKAVIMGSATPGQQKRAMDAIINEIAGAGRNCFTGESPYGTAFRAGAAAVGQILLMIKDTKLGLSGNQEHDG